MTSLLSRSSITRDSYVDEKRSNHISVQSDCTEEIEELSGNFKRSVSLASLQPSIFEPRMAQLETLEAKMASIEVSLSSSPRRKKGSSLSNASIGGSVRSIPKEVAVKELETLRNALRDKENIIQSLKGQLNIPGLRLSQIRNGSLGTNNSCNNIRELSEVERKQAEDRLGRLRNDIDTKRLAIKNLKLALERLDITDNIDVRIQQAELEYQLGREELNLLTLLEESRALQHCLEESKKKLSDSHTLFSCLNESDLSLHTIEIIYDPKSPRFGAGQKDSSPGLWVDWALEDTGLFKGDRLIEVNGKIVLTKTRDDLARLLQVAPDPATLVLLRKGGSGGCTVSSNNNASREVAALRCELEVVKERAEEVQRAKDGLRSDNIRLTHRISYLEEQVNELLTRRSAIHENPQLNQSPVITSTVKTNQNVTNINISSRPSSTMSNKNEPQIFQKGSQKTALINAFDSKKDSQSIRSKSSLSNISNTHITPTSPQPSEQSCHKSHRHKQHRSSRNGLMMSSSAQNLDHLFKNGHHPHHHHHHHRKEKDYNSETSSLIENHRSRKSLEHSRLVDYNDANVMEQSYRKATKIVQDLTKNHLYEKHRSNCLEPSEVYGPKQFNPKKSTSILDFRSEIQLGPKYSDSRSVEELDTIQSKSQNKRLYKKLHDARSVKSLDFDSDCNQPGRAKKAIDYTSEPLDANKNSSKPRPTPPKKPLRLSLHRAQSLHSVETPPVTPEETSPSSQEKNDPRKPLKRNHKGEPPAINPHKSNETISIVGQVGSRSESKWTSFAQKKDHFVYGNDSKKHWC